MKSERNTSYPINGLVIEVSQSRDCHEISTLVVSLTDEIDDKT